MIRLHIKKGLLGEDGAETVQLEPLVGLTPRKLLESFARHLPSSVPIDVGLGGNLLTDDQLDVELQDGQDVFLVPRTTFGLDLVALLVYAVVMAVVSFAVNYLMSTLSPRPKPPGVPQERGDESSPTYAWDGIQTSYGQGFPVPFVYGRHAVGGQVIYTDVYASTAGGTLDDRLKMVLALCEGPIARVGDVTATELNGLGGLTGVIPGPPIPNHIRVNNNLLQNQAVGIPTTNINCTAWSPVATFTVGAVLTVKSAGTPVGTVQVLDVRNPQRTDLDLVLVSGTIAIGNTLHDIGSFAPQPTATLTLVTTIIRVNQTPGVRVWIRPGTLDQTPLPSNPFRGASVTFTPNIQLNEVSDESVFTYGGTEQITTIGFVVAFPAGLYALDPQGAQLAYPVLVEFYWRPQGTTAWRSFYAPGTSTQVNSRSIGSTPRVGPVLESWGADLASLQGYPERGPIEVRMVRRSPSGGTNAISGMVWRNVFFNTAHTFAYPRVALMGMELSAGARFSGGLPNVTVRVDGLLVRLWDPTHGFSARTWDAFTSGNWAFSTKPPGRNPAWILLDFFTSPWGLGKWIKDADLDLPSFRRWAAFCDMDPSPGTPWNEPAFQCDLVGDSPRPAWEWVLTICAAGRASPVVRNGKIGVVYQYRDTHFDAGIGVAAKAPVQLLTSSSVEKVQVTWLPKGSRPTAYLFQFLNATNLYVQDVLPVEDSEGTLNDPSALIKEQWRPETVQAYGVTRPSQLFREGVYRHRVNRLIRRELQFTAGRWALAAEVGDLIEFEHDVLRPFDADVPLNMVVSVGGSAVSVVTVDHVATGATAIVMRDADGKPVTRTITGTVVVGSTTQLTLNAPVTVAAGATCVLGLASKLTEIYEVVAISLQKDLKREVRAVQWVPEVHDEVTPAEYAAGGIDGGVDGPEGFLDQPDEGEPTVSDLQVVVMRDGTHRIAWTKPPNRATASVRVYVRTDATIGWSLVGETATSDIGWLGCTAGVLYSISACLEGSNGQHPTPDDGAQLRFTAPEFPPFAPPSVTNARAVALDDLVLVQWDDLDLRDLDTYELRLGSNWTAGRVLHRSRAPRALLANAPGSGTVLVAARSTSGLYGNPVPLTLPTWTPRNTVAAVSDDDLAPSPAGTHTDTEFSGGRLQLQAGKLTGNYVSLAQDVGYQAPIYWQVRLLGSEIENAPVNELQVQVASGEARWWTVDGRPASPGSPGIDWQTKVDDLAKPIDDLRSELLVHGHVGEVGSHTRIFVESRFEVGGVWTAYSEHTDRTVVARKMQVRITLNRASTRYEPRVTALTYVGSI
jgi:hypothetical protein